MTAKETAEELVEKFLHQFAIRDSFHPAYINGETDEDNMKYAKQCALIAVDEIISEFYMIEGRYTFHTDYPTVKSREKFWEEVKQEIEKL